MASGRNQRRSGRQRAGRAWLVLIALPALLFGPAFSGAVAWFHAHGAEGAHVHLLLEEHHHAHGQGVVAHEEDRHSHHPDGGETGDDEPGHGDGGPVPHGFRIELPAFDAAPTRGSSPIPPATTHSLAGPPASRGPTVPSVAPTHPVRIRSGWPPQGAQRSGVAALLRSSHAILI